MEALVFFGSFEQLEARRLFAIPGTTLGSYHTYASMGADLKVYAQTYPSLTKLISIGKSTENRDLWALKISDNPNQQEDEPELRFIGAMHGDEPVGMENTLYFATKLLEGYGQNARITKLVNGSEIWLIPNMNPDGLVHEQRGNANDLDLNRSFPEGTLQDLGNVFDGPKINTSGLEAEVAAMMKFSASQSFTASINFHGGTVVANYPYDTNNNGYPDDAPTPDDGLFRELALTYSRQNQTMYNSYEFEQGITNGDEWYEVAGGMQDWNYRYLSDYHLTVELSYEKQPDASEIPSFWQENEESMMQYAEAIHWGVRGVVTRATDGAPVYAKVKISGNSQAVYSDPQVGDYHRLLLPGKYSFTFSAPGYESKTVKNVEVTEKTNDASLTRRLNVELTPTDLTAPALVSSSHAYNLNPPSVLFSFNEDVGASINPLDVQLLDESYREAGATIVSSWDESTLTARFAYSPKLKDGNYRMRLLAPRIRDAWGNAMAEGQTVNFYQLAGDANRDRKVDLKDWSILKSNFGASGDYGQGDFNYSGAVESRDFNVLLSRYGKTLPPPVQTASVMQTAVFLNRPAQVDDVLIDQLL